MNTPRRYARFTTRATPSTALAASERTELSALLGTYFDGITDAQFARDLAGKNWILRLYADDRLAGFSTLAVDTTEAAGRTVTLVYSGDTIVAPEAWGSPELAKGWIRLVHTVLAQRPALPAYWLLLSSGFRTYRFLPVFWREFWPRHGAVMPPDACALRDALARARFGSDYDSSTGIVRFARPQRLRGRLAEVPAERRRDPHVAFFLTANPGHGAGDELVCLTELSDANLTAAGQRIVREAGP